MREDSERAKGKETTPTEKWKERKRRGRREKEMTDC